MAALYYARLITTATDEVYSIFLLSVNATESDADDAAAVVVAQAPGQVPPICSLCLAVGVCPYPVHIIARCV